MLINIVLNLEKEIKMVAILYGCATFAPINFIRGKKLSGIRPYVLIGRINWVYQGKLIKKFIQLHQFFFSRRRSMTNGFRLINSLARIAAVFY
jgi:hypothetical protein